MKSKVKTFTAVDWHELIDESDIEDAHEAILESDWTFCGLQITIVGIDEFFDFVENDWCMAGTKSSKSVREAAKKTNAQYVIL